MQHHACIVFDIIFFPFQTSAGKILLKYNKEDLSVIQDLGSYENGDFYTNPNNTVKIQWTDKTSDSEMNSIVISFANGISAMVNGSASKGLYFTLWVPESFQGLTTGLLGNFNGDSFDDLTLFNMTILPENAMDEQIHEFGESCEFYMNMFTN